MTDLTAPYGPLAFFLDLHPDIGDFRTDALEGLSRDQKALSPKYFYDERGSKLFDKITQLDDYYPTRTEKEIFLTHAADITGALGGGVAVFEYGSGSSEKIDWLLNGLEAPAAYIAMDISKEHLISSASAIARARDLPVAAVCADFHAPVEIPVDHLPDARQWLGYFPGSTIGNMDPETAAAFLRRASDTLGDGARFLFGVDLEKDPDVLNKAYNDSEGITAAFNLNLLRRMRRELDAELNLDDFEHHAFYNQDQSRIEMHLRAVRPTAIKLNDQSFAFADGETLHTENSYKYSVARLKALVETTPWRVDQ
ncbi:MAG: L-histidine N(alpha)-methyltransferase, partial [Hyphococcus sp.]